MERGKGDESTAAGGGGKKPGLGRVHTYKRKTEGPFLRKKKRKRK